MVDPKISKSLLDFEVQDAQPFVNAMGWDLVRVSDLNVSLTMVAPEREGKRERYTFDFFFDDYADKPPIIDLVHPETQARNEPTCFPTGHGYWHGKARICAGWSRRAYKEEFADGPHDDFHCSSWKTHAEGVVNFGLMLQEIWKALNEPTYRGREVA